MPVKPPSPISTESRHILLMMSGSIAAAKASELISRWRQAGHRVRVMVTPATLHFVGMATLEGLSGEPVLADTFAPGHAMAHIDWVRWADLIVLAPATANRLTALYQGRGDDLVGTALLAVAPGTPVVVVPAMNTRMWQQAAVQTAVSGLKQRGLIVLPPASGALACGETGEGRLPEIETIVRFLQRRFLQAASTTGQHAGANKRILITAGGTAEPVDAVRVLSNRSSGRTGATLADALAARGHRVTLLHGEQAAQPRWPMQTRRFADFADLQEKLQQAVGSEPFDAVIHAAAVSDYSVASINAAPAQASTAGKLSSHAETLTIRLRRNPKLVDRIKQWSQNRKTQLVAFKLTASKDAAERQAAITRLQQRSGADWVVHNDQLEINAGRHRFQLLGENAVPVAECENAGVLAEKLEAALWPGLWPELSQPEAPQSLPQAITATRKTS